MNSDVIAYSILCLKISLKTVNGGGGESVNVGLLNPVFLAPLVIMLLKFGVKLLILLFHVSDTKYIPIVDPKVIQTEKKGKEGKAFPQYSLTLLSMALIALNYVFLIVENMVIKIAHPKKIYEFAIINILLEYQMYNQY